MYKLLNGTTWYFALLTVVISVISHNCETITITSRQQASQVYIIPYTYQHTRTRQDILEPQSRFGDKLLGIRVNLDKLLGIRVNLDKLLGIRVNSDKLLELKS